MSRKHYNRPVQLVSESCLGEEPIFCRNARQVLSQHLNNGAWCFCNAVATGGLETGRVLAICPVAAKMQVKKKKKKKKHWPISSATGAFHNLSRRRD